MQSNAIKSLTSNSLSIAMSQRSLPRLYFTVAALAACIHSPQALAAQSGDIPELGPGSALAAGLSLDEASRAPNTPEATLVSPPFGSTTVLLQEFTPLRYPLVPDYSIAAMFPNLVGDIELNAKSTGNSQMAPLDNQGLPLVGTSDRWQGTVLSVDNAAQGLPTGPIARRLGLTSGRTTPGADLYSFYATDSLGLHDSVAGSAFLEQSAESFGFGGASATQEVDALDFGMGVLSESGSTRDAVLFPNRETVYFSLDPSCLMDVNSATGGAFAMLNGQFVPADACTVYEIHWSETQFTWSTPCVYVTAADLMLVPGVDDIDALEVDTRLGTVVFSTQIHPTRSQLRIYGKDPQENYVLADFRDSTGDLVTTKAGLRDPLEGSPADNVDAVCIIDPEYSVHPVYFGVPRDIAFGNSGLGQLGVSVTRCRPTRTSDEIMVVHASGWAGVPPTTQGRIHFYYSNSYDSSTSWLLSTWELLSIVDRLPGEDLSVTTYTLPPNLTTEGSGVCAFFVDLQGNILASSTIAQFSIVE